MRERRTQRDHERLMQHLRLGLEHRGSPSRRAHRRQLTRRKTLQGHRAPSHPPLRRGDEASAQLAQSWTAIQRHGRATLSIRSGGEVERKRSFRAASTADRRVTLQIGDLGGGRTRFLRPATAEDLGDRRAIYRGSLVVGDAQGQHDACALLRPVPDLFSRSATTCLSVS